MRAISADEEHRYQNAREMAAALDQALSFAEPEPPKPVAPPAPDTWVVPKTTVASRWPLAVAIVAAVAIAAFIVAFLYA